MTLKKLIHAMLTCKLHYCNIVSNGMSVKSLNKLQKMQNAAVRLIFNISTRCSVRNKIR